MKRFLRSTFVSGAVVLSVVSTSGAVAHSASSEETGSRVGAPDCVRLNTDWRYTFVTNGCSSAYSVTVVYRDGTEVPCRSASPGDTLTFPGYGTQGNEVLGAALCVDGGGALRVGREPASW